MVQFCLSSTAISQIHTYVEKGQRTPSQVYADHYCLSRKWLDIFHARITRDPRSETRETLYKLNLRAVPRKSTYQHSDICMGCACLEINRMNEGEEDLIKDFRI